MTLSLGDETPHFELVDQYGETVRRADYLGEHLLVWWTSSAAASGGCCGNTTSSIGQIVAEHPDLKVVGIAFETHDQLQPLIAKAGIAFPLLTDPTKTVGEAFGVRRGEGRDWDSFPLKRAFLVDPKGKIAQIYSNVDLAVIMPSARAHALNEQEARAVSKKRTLLQRLVGA